MVANKYLVNTLIIFVTVLVALSIYYLINIGNEKVDYGKKIKLNLKNAKKLSVIILLVIFVLYFIIKYPIILNTFWVFVASTIIAYIINPLVKKLEEKGLKRTFSILAIYVGILFILIFTMALVIPNITEQARSFIDRLPSLVSGTVAYLQEIIGNIFKNYPESKDIFNNAWVKLSSQINNLQGRIIDIVSRTGQSTGSFIRNLINLILVPIVTYYLIMYKEKFITSIISYVPDKNKTKFMAVCKDLDNAYSHFIIARLVMAILTGVLTNIYLLILGVDFSFVIGVLTAVGDIIPFIGPFIAVFPAILIALTEGIWKAFLVVVGFVIIQWIENHLIAPKLMSRSIGLNPLAVLFSVIIGGSIFGVFGMILSIPFVATVKILFLHYYKDIVDFFYK
ncbi:MAG: AI-2E family transporter [Finegoldia sp.]|nr:AI-2E family transporter [Finegoldia sp.]